jgi:Protein of unknown function (DUF3046)
VAAAQAGGGQVSGRPSIVPGGAGKGLRATTVERVRLTYFRELMEGEFGIARAAAVSRDHVFAELGGRTVEQALEAGIEPREVWLAVCNAYDVPPSRR